MFWVTVPAPMEGLVLLGLAACAALLMALVGVPVLFSKLNNQAIELAALRARLEKLAARLSVLERPAEAGRATAPTPAPAPPVAAAPVSVATPVPVMREPVRAPAPMPAVAPPARAPAPPPAPDLAAMIGGWIRDYFTGGNPMVRVGIIVLFFGVAFLLKFAAEHSMLPIEFRLAGASLLAIVLLAIGWRQRLARPAFGLALQGGAVAILYLTIFAAYRLYHLLPPGAAFGLLLVVAAASSLLAVKQDSMAFAMLSAAGGFAAPILASSGEGSHVALFSYYALLNAGIVAIAWYKAWRPLNVLAFVATFAVGTAWGVLRYRPEQLVSTEPFVLLFFVMFLGIAVLFAWHRAPELKHYVDGTLVFGNPVAYMGLQSALLEHSSMGRAYAALFAAAVYLALASWLHRLARPALTLLFESFLAIGIGFLTLAVPFALGGEWTGATWAIEGAAILWAAIRQQRGLAMIAALVLQLAAGVALAVDSHGGHAEFIGGVLIAAAGIHTAWQLRAPIPWLGRLAPYLSHLFVAWGLLWWLGAAANELDRVLPPAHTEAAHLVLLALTALVTGLAAPRWPALRVPAMLLLPVLWMFLWHGVAPGGHPFAADGWAAWPVALVIWGTLLYRSDAALNARAGSALHVATLWLLASIGAWELGWQLDHWAAGAHSWSALGAAVVPAALLAWIAEGSRARWPLRSQLGAYVQIGGAGLALYLALWNLWLCVTADGDAAPLRYLPLLNPVDLAQGITLAVILLWSRAAALSARYEQARRAVPIALALLVFAWLNALLLRALHHYAAIAYELAPMLSSTLAQSSLSVFWTLIAMLTTLWAHRAGRRAAWIAGACLMGVVVAKLFLVDLARVGTVARIVAFLVSGTLMLVVGYFAPLPPAPEKKP